MAHPFIIGERYFDRSGDYVVTALSEKRVTYKYENGKEGDSDIETKAQIYKSILGEQRAAHPYQTPGYFRMLGFFSNHADFQAEVPPQSQSSFEERYKILTGKKPILKCDGYYPIEVITGNEKWGKELRIYVPDTVRAIADLPDGIELRSVGTENMLRINNNDLWWLLVRAGFRLGKKHEIASIKESVPKAFLKNFNEGLAL